MPVEEDAFVETLASLGIAGALVAGVTGSVHCALMCGPLACLPLAKQRDARAALAWQLGRLTAYALVGFTLGALGRSALLLVRTDVTPVLPWVMAAGLVLTAFDVGRKLPAIPGVARVSRLLARAGQRTSPLARAALLGAATPFLPCGLLYGMFLAALASGTPARGALVLGAFALGSAPALGAVQLGAGRFQVPPWVRRAVLLAAAGLLIFRALTLHTEVAQCG